jgi:hypothetical protein
MSRSAATVDDESERDPLTGPETPSGALTLVFTSQGQCVLEEDDEPVWFSDDDDDFQSDFGDEFLDPDQDDKRILNWLEEEGWLEEEEKSQVDIEVETDGDEN